ncbi:hypothetical protein BCF58_2065 [Chryseobacterium defluvii]|uniref:Uncharacterized protein n=2 Tax=Chryseobacterium defluvii TaxID=160396 RepID=A0A495SEG9_9FLAO|nr:hypothetical protein BCF58_2065 [Chryseobacterium defluvii]
MRPDYKKIYVDILDKKHPQKKDDCKKILSKKQLTSLDIIELNTIIFGHSSDVLNPSHRSYDPNSIFKILEYQKAHNLSNTKLAQHFKLSKNTVSQWKKKFI